MEKKKPQRVWRGWRVISSIVCALLVVCQGLLMFQLWKLKMLPMKFFLPVLALMVIVDIPLIVMMFPRTGRWQKSAKHGKKIVSYVLSLILAAGCFVGWRAVQKGDQTVDRITQTTTVAAQVGVYVLAEDSAASIADARGYTFAVTNLRDKENTQAAVSAIEKELGSSIDQKTCANFEEMAQALYSGKAQALILNVSYAGLFDENEQFKDFRDRTRLLYTYNVEKVVEPTEAPTEGHEEPTEPKAVSETPFVIYLSGSDTRSDTLTDSVSRSDVNILAVVHPATKQILLVNTPRDYYIENPAYGVMDKLTHCGLDGMSNSMQALSNLYGCDIRYNAQINFTGFETLIDAVGGINIYAEEGDGVHLSAGDNYMDGEQALEFARDRYNYSDGDNARGRHQMMVITAVVDKLTSPAIVNNYSSILDSLQGMFSTNVPSDTVRELIKMQLNDMASWDIHSYAVTGTGGMDSTIAGTASVMYPDDATVEHASRLIDRVLNGETITDADVAPME